MKLNPMYVIWLAIGIYFLAYAVPPALTVLFNVSTEGWDPAVVGLWGLIGLLVIVAILSVFLPDTKTGE